MADIRQPNDWRTDSNPGDHPAYANIETGLGQPWWRTDDAPLILACGHQASGFYRYSVPLCLDCDPDAWHNLGQK